MHLLQGLGLHVQDQVGVRSAGDLQGRVPLLQGLPGLVRFDQLDSFGFESLEAGGRILQGRERVGWRDRD